MATEYAGELVIEWPEHDPEFRRAPLGRLTTLFEYRMGYGLKMLDGVVAVAVHASANNGHITAEVTREYLTGDEDKPLERHVTTWLVVGMREKS